MDNASSPKLEDSLNMEASDGFVIQANFFLKKELVQCAAHKVVFDKSSPLVNSR